MTLSIAILLFVTAQRIGELALSRFNTARLKASGAIEFAPAHYPLIVALHAAWLAGLWYLAPGTEPRLGWLAVFAALEVLRVWVLMTLGRRWTTRILVMPGAPLLAAGPYRFIAHPNYCVVIGEILVLPLIFGLVRFAILFSLLNIAILSVRIRAENRALGR